MSSTPAASSHASSGASYSVLALPPSFLSTPYLSDPRLPVTSAGLSPLRSVSPNPGAVFSAPVPLQPLPSPTLASVDPRTLALLSISAPASPAERAALAEAFAGNALLPGSTPAAHCYAGHQFGSFSGQLGDGANLNLGLAPGGHWLQLKGSGRTPYSRTADGRKVLRSTIREYLGSIFLDRAGVPTTLAASLTVSTKRITRDKFYSGQVSHELCAVVSRVAKGASFFRFGSFEIYKDTDPLTRRAGPNPLDADMCRGFYDYIAETYFPSVSSPLEFMLEQARSTARLFAAWDAIGFTHGVLNTDNMSLHGLTIDYGPYGFQEAFDFTHTPNGSDNTQRYCYEKQREIGEWNLLKLAEVLRANGVLGEAGDAEIKSAYAEAYDAAILDAMRRKLGLAQGGGDRGLWDALLTTMEATHADFTDTFLALETFAANPDDMMAALDELALVCSPPASVAASCERKLKITRPSMDPRQLMQLWEVAQSDPEKLAAHFGAPAAAIVAELRGEMDKLEAYSKVAQLQDKFANTEEEEKRDADRASWRAWMGRYKKALEDGGSTGEERVALMQSANPRFVPKNWQLQEIIDRAERGDYDGVNEMVEAADHVFDAGWWKGGERGILGKRQREAPKSADGLYNT